MDGPEMVNSAIEARLRRESTTIDVAVAAATIPNIWRPPDGSAQG
jgi:hypothetical protein